MVVLRNRKNTQEHQVAFAEAKAKAQAQAKAEAEAKLQAEAEAKTDKIQEWLVACAKIQELLATCAKIQEMWDARAKAKLSGPCACEVDDKWADDKWYQTHASSGKCHAYKPWI